MTKLKITLFTLTMLCFMQIYGQTSLISGKITDALGQPIPGISVKVKGTTVGTSSDAKGIFSIKSANPATLIFSGIGYVSKEFAYSGQSNITIT
ncbi:hypothetical protein D3C73_971550 [compost metagenome]